MQPLVVIDGEYSASLDGLTLGGDRILEVKCPYKGTASALWQALEAGELPDHYRWQVQHQLMVTQAEIADLFVFDGNEGIVFPVAPDPSTWPRIQAAWDEFMQFITGGSPPPLTDRDTRQRDDPEWLSAAAAYLELRAEYEALSAKYDEAKVALIDLASHAKEQGGGVSVTRFWKKGAVEYRKIPGIAELDLEQFRAAPREETRVTLA